MPAVRERPQGFGMLDLTSMYTRQLSTRSYVEEVGCAPIQVFGLGGDLHANSALVGDLGFPSFAIARAKPDRPVIDSSAVLPRLTPRIASRRSPGAASFDDRSPLVGRWLFHGLDSGRHHLGGRIAIVHGQAPVTPFAATERLDCQPQILAIEVRPQRVDEQELRVG